MSALEDFQEVAAESRILDTVQAQWLMATQNWADAIISAAETVFISLAVIQIAWFGILWMLNKEDDAGLFQAFLKKILAIGFFWTLLKMAPVWIPALVDGFIYVGAEAAQVAYLTPSQVLNQGLAVGSKWLNLAEVSSMFAVHEQIGRYFIYFIILGAFAVIAGQLLVTMIEAYVVLTAGLLYLGFSATQWTHGFATKYLNYALGVGIKLFMLYLIIGAGSAFAAQWATLIAADPGLQTGAAIAMSAIIYTFVAWQIPTYASAMMSGSVATTLGGAAATAVTVGAAGLAAGAAAKTVGGMGVRGVKNLATSGAGMAIGGAAMGAASGAMGMAKSALGLGAEGPNLSSPPTPGGDSPGSGGGGAPGGGGGGASAAPAAGAESLAPASTGTPDSAPAFSGAPGEAQSGGSGSDNAKSGGGAAAAGGATAAASGSGSAGGGLMESAQKLAGSDNMPMTGGGGLEPGSGIDLENDK